MRVNIGEGSFDNEAVFEILQHAEKMCGRKLGELAQTMGRPDMLTRAGKGVSGQLIQLWFGVEPDDNRPEPDLVNVRHEDGKVLGVEIKAVPLRLVSRGLSIKERSSVGMIDYAKLLKEKWETSHARKKLSAVLFVFFEYAGQENWAESRVRQTVLWKIGGSTEGIMQSDWQAAWMMVDEGRAHELSESQAHYLSATTKGPGGPGSNVVQPKAMADGTKHLARRRCFALKPAFLRTQWERHERPEAFKSIETLTGKRIAGRLQEAILDSLAPYVGMRLGATAAKLGLKIDGSKNAASTLLRRALGVKDDKVRLLELEEQGVSVKTLPVREDTLMPMEAMSFPSTKLKEFVEEDWESSEILARLECLLILPVLARDRQEAKASRRLGKPFFWSPTAEEWEGIEHEWNIYKEAVVTGLAKAVFVERNGKSYRVTNLPKSSETTFIHMRPHGKDGTDMDEDALGNKTPKLSFWLNQPFLQKVLKRHLVD